MAARVSAASLRSRAEESEEKSLLMDYSRKHGLANTCRLMWNMNEFLFIDDCYWEI